MNRVGLVIGIIITGLSLLAITVFSISKFILKRIYKEEEKAKTQEQKNKEKTVKRALKSTKFVLKKVYKKLLQNYLAFYGITALTFSTGATLVTVSSVSIVKEQRETETSSEAPSSLEPSSKLTSSEISSSTELSSNIEISSEENSSVEPSSEVSTSEVSSSEEEVTSSSEEEVSSSSEETSSSIEETTSSEEKGPLCTVYFQIEDQPNPIYTLLVKKGCPVEDPGTVDLSNMKKIFKYWTDDLGSGIQYDFTTPITEDTTIYGVTAVGYTVTYMIRDYSCGFEYDHQELVEENTHADNIQVPYKNDPQYYYTWYTHLNDDPSEDRELYDFNASFVNEDLTLFGY